MCVFFLSLFVMVLQNECGFFEMNLVWVNIISQKEFMWLPYFLNGLKYMLMFMTLLKIRFMASICSKKYVQL